MANESIGFGNLKQQKSSDKEVKELVISPYIIREAKGYVVAYVHDKDRLTAEEWVEALSWRGHIELRKVGTRTGKPSGKKHSTYLYQEPEDENYVQEMFTKPN